jgi:hypothetical protein
MKEPIFSILTGKPPTAATASGACCNINGDFTLDGISTSQNTPNGTPFYSKIVNGQLIARIYYNPFASRWEIESQDTDGLLIRYISYSSYESPPQQGWELINGGVDFNVIINLS